MSPYVNETPRTMELTQERTSSALTPAQVYQRKYQHEYRQWKAAMTAQGTPVSGRAVPRKSRSKLAYEITTRYTERSERNSNDD